MQPIGYLVRHGAKFELVGISLWPVWDGLAVSDRRLHVGRRRVELWRREVPAVIGPGILVVTY